MNNEKLYSDTKSFIRKYLYADKTEIDMIVHYASVTHIFDLLPACAYLHINGDFNTGKNRRIDLLKLICHNPIPVSNTSLSYVFRKLDEEKGTVLIDECDRLLVNPEFMNFLLVGYKRGGCVTRSTPDNNHSKGFRPDEFDVYSPKVLITREGIESDALNSRVITLITFPMPDSIEMPTYLPREAYVEAEELRNRIRTLMLKNEIVDSSMINLGLKGRDAEIFECLKNVACIYGEEAISDLKYFVDHVYLPESKYNTIMSFQEDLIRVLNDCWTNDTIAHLTLLQTKLQSQSDDYKNLSVKRIARALRSLRFQIERDNKGNFVVHNEKLLDVWKARYLSKSQVVQHPVLPKLDIALEDTSAYNSVDSVEGVAKSKIEDYTHRKAREIVAKALSRLGSRRRNR